MAIVNPSDTTATERTLDTDPIAAEVIRNALKAAADQQRVAIIRTAFSGTIYDWQDFSTGLFDDQYRMLAQDDGPPGFLGTLSPAIEAMVDESGGREALRPGDVILSTYAYDIGTHAQDLTLAIPAFYEDELVGFAGIKGHVIDIGQKDAMLGVDTIDTWQEGTIYPSVKLFSAGRRNDDLWRTLLANSRMPDGLAGDVSAFLGGGRVGLDALARVIGRYGLADFRRAVELMYDHSEALVREKIAAIPDGRYVATAVIDAFDPDDPLSFDVAVEVAGSDLIVDYTAAPPQLPLPYNSLRGATVGLSRCYVLAVIGGTDSVNDGFLRPIEVRTTPGTVLHATAPAPVSMYFYSGCAIEAVFVALSQAVPQMVSAGTGAGVQVLFAYGMNPDGTFWGGAFNMTSGQGASPHHDGAAPLMMIGSGSMRAMSCEVFEARTPFVFDRFELGCDSGGAGTFRGSPGIDFEIRTRQPLAATILLEGEHAPRGLGQQGGGDGRPNIGTILYPDGTRAPIAKVAGLPLPEGAVIDVKTGGGGGYGSPAERDPQLVRDDVAEGYVSEEAARVDYPDAVQ